MKRFTLFLIFCLPLLLGASSVRILTGDLHGGTIQKATDRNVTLYVRTTGNDVNDCLTTGNACLTIQEAISRIPKEIQHDVVVDIGEGSFAAFNVDGYNIDFNGNFDIQGTLGLVSLSGTKPNSGTPSAVGSSDNHRYMDDTDHGLDNWAVDELVGKLLDCSGPVGNTGHPIIANTTTRIHYAGSETCLTSYEILEQKTVLTGTGGQSYAPIEITNVFSFWPNRFEIRNVKSTDSATIGILMYASSGTVERCYMSGKAYNYALGQSPRVARAADCYSGINIFGGFVFQQSGGVTVEDPAGERIVANNASTTGPAIYLMQSNTVRLKHAYGYNSGRVGLGIEAVQYALIEDSEFFDNTQSGVRVDTDQANLTIAPDGAVSNVHLDTTVIHDNQDGVYATNGAIVQFYNTTGTGNSQHGVELVHGAKLTHMTGNTLTGTSGDITLNGGTTTHTWAEVNANDYYNSDNGCRAWKP
ncbi:MAG: hypothetical protein AM326_03380 [Candidatus Thorarchaeota archaeon SMTZ-45]|nr:MAG: hypothetical protein AM326_03380 [Candidatus Thorarchaeota archaeon SMTZ-45]